MGLIKVKERKMKETCEEIKELQRKFNDTQQNKRNNNRENPKIHGNLEIP